MPDQAVPGIPLSSPANGDSVVGVQGGQVRRFPVNLLLVQPHVGPLPPVAPAVGKEWINSNSGKKYTWYDDGTSAQWVEAAGFYYVDDPVSVLAAQQARDAAQGHANVATTKAAEAAGSAALVQAQISLRSYGASANGNLGGLGGGLDCWIALEAAAAAGYRSFKLEYAPGESDVAYFSQFNAHSLGANGYTLDIDPRITVSVPDSGVAGEPNSVGIRHVRPTRYYMRGLNDYYTVNSDSSDLWYGNGSVRRMPHIDPDDAEVTVAVEVQALDAVVPRVISWNNSDAWADTVFDSTAGATYALDLVGGSFALGMVACKPGDEFVVSMEASDPAAIVAACIRHTNGFAGLFSDYSYSAIPQYFSKLTGQVGTSSPQAPLGVGTHETYSAAGAMWTIRIDSWQSFSILWNGMAMARATVPGVIYECGFGGYRTAPGQTVTVHDQVRVRGGKYRGGEFCAVRVYGDSKTAQRADAWPLYFKDALEFAAGVRCWKVVNRAVAGQGVAGQRNLMAGDNVADCNLVIIDIGTNDIQGLNPVANFLYDLTAMVDQAQAARCNVILGVPSLWYTRTQAGPRGQMSVNYGRGARYRSAIMRLAAQKGCRVVDNTRFDGPVLANYVNPDVALGANLTAAGDAVMYDNIHPTTEANRLRALAYAKVAAGLYANKRGDLYLPLHNVGAPTSGWAVTIQAVQATISADGVVKLYGVVNDPGGAIRADGTSIYQLPAYLRPPVELRVRPVSSMTDEPTFLSIMPDGRINVYGAVASTWFDLSSISYSIENREAL